MLLVGPAAVRFLYERKPFQSPLHGGLGTCAAAKTLNQGFIQLPEIPQRVGGYALARAQAHPVRAVEVGIPVCIPLAEFLVRTDTIILRKRGIRAV